ncbi:hypothetical protein P7K49_025599, partial [Saguinus oedipus]
GEGGERGGAGAPAKPWGREGAPSQRPNPGNFPQPGQEFLRSPRTSGRRVEGRR